jgi:hypothetical protein
MKCTTVIGGVWNIDSITGEIMVNNNKLDAIIEATSPNLDDGIGFFVIILYDNPDIPITSEDICIRLPTVYKSTEILDKDNNIVIIIERIDEKIPEHTTPY